VKAITLLLVLGLAACGDDELIPSIDAAGPDATPIDAQLADLGCLGDPAPTTAADPLSLGGEVRDEDTGAVLANVAVELFAFAGDTSLGTATTDAQGIYSITFATGGTAQDVYFRFTATGYPDHVLIPPFPAFANNPSIRIALVSDTLLAATETEHGFTVGGGEGLLLVSARDCAGDPLVPDATVAITPAPAGSVEIDGAIWAHGLAPGDGDVDVTNEGDAFRDRPTRLFGNEITRSFRFP
jgi:hypothetical protein